MIKYQDLHLSDVTLNQQFKTAMSNGSYSDAFSILQNSQLLDKTMVAAVLNYLADKIIEVENTSDATFKNDLIKVSETPPSGLSSGDVYFELKE